MFEIWEMRSGNLAGTFSTRDEALKVVRGAVEKHGRRYVDNFSLVGEASGRTTTIAEGSALADLALPAAPKRAVTQGDPSPLSARRVSSSSRAAHSYDLVGGTQRVAAKHPRSGTMATGKKAASEAGKELGSKRSSKGEKTVAASDLAQAKKGSGKKSPRSR